uniref:Uncharacterized protein n=1 Tax=Thermococcus sp. AMT11 TaxID=563043 RepID=C8BNE8_9EURY|nr:unknown [Thermococcus sp. AMT11]
MGKRSELAEQLWPFFLIFLDSVTYCVKYEVLDILVVTFFNQRFYFFYEGNRHLNLFPDRGGFFFPPAHISPPFVFFIDAKLYIAFLLLTEKYRHLPYNYRYFPENI